MNEIKAEFDGTIVEIAVEIVRLLNMINYCS